MTNLVEVADAFVILTFFRSVPTDEWPLSTTIVLVVVGPFPIFRIIRPLISAGTHSKVFAIRRIIALAAVPRVAPNIRRIANIERRLRHGDNADLHVTQAVCATNSVNRIHVGQGILQIHERKNVVSVRRIQVDIVVIPRHLASRPIK